MECNYKEVKVIVYEMMALFITKLKEFGYERLSFSGNSELYWIKFHFKALKKIAELQCDKRKVMQCRNLLKNI